MEPQDALIQVIVIRHMATINLMVFMHAIQVHIEVEDAIFIRLMMDVHFQELKMRKMAFHIMHVPHFKLKTLTTKQKISPLNA